MCMIFQARSFWLQFRIPISFVREKFLFYFGNEETEVKESNVIKRESEEIEESNNSKKEVKENKNYKSSLTNILDTIMVTAIVLAIVAAIFGIIAIRRIIK